MMIPRLIGFVNPSADAFGRTYQCGIGLDLLNLVLANAILLAIGSMLHPRAAT